MLLKPPPALTSGNALKYLPSYAISCRARGLTRTSCRRIRFLRKGLWRRGPHVSKDGVLQTGGDGKSFAGETRIITTLCFVSLLILWLFSLCAICWSGPKYISTFLFVVHLYSVFVCVPTPPTNPSEPSCVRNVNAHPLMLLFWAAFSSVIGVYSRLLFEFI